MIVPAISCTAVAGVVDSPNFSAGPLVIVAGGIEGTGTQARPLVVGDFYLLEQSGSVGRDLIDTDLVGAGLVDGGFQPLGDLGGGAESFRFRRTNGGRFTDNGQLGALDTEDRYSRAIVTDRSEITLNGRLERVSRFFVASNTAFHIRAEATGLATRGRFDTLGYADIGYRLRLETQGGSGANAWGRSAQDPAGDARGITFAQNGPNRWSLANLASGPVTVFEAGRRTAATRGSLLDQMVALRSTYRLNASGANGNGYDLSQGTGEISATVTYTIYAP